MAIGAISAYGAVGGMSAVHFRPYVYRANTVSSASMNKLSRISDDVLEQKIDYSELADERLNENPLKKGQTLDFQGILAMQMSRGQNIAARIMRPVESGAGAEQGAAADTASQMTAGMDTVAARRMNAGTDAADASRMTTGTDATEARFDVSGTEETSSADEMAVKQDAEAAADAGGGNINYQMQQALRAYEMFMTA